MECVIFRQPDAPVLNLEGRVGPHVVRVDVSAERVGSRYGMTYGRDIERQEVLPRRLPENLEVIAAL